MFRIDDAMMCDVLFWVCHDVRSVIVGLTIWHRMEKTVKATAGKRIAVDEERGERENVERGSPSGRATAEERTRLTMMNM